MNDVSRVAAGAVEEASQYNVDGYVHWHYTCMPCGQRMRMRSASERRFDCINCGRPYVIVADGHVYAEVPLPARTPPSPPPSRSLAPVFAKDSVRPRVDESSMLQLVRSLVKLRVDRDPLATLLGFDSTLVDSASSEELIGTPEATVATIVASYALLVHVGKNEQAALLAIESNRARLGATAPQHFDSLESYVQRRIAIEYDDVAGISAEFIWLATAASRRHFGLS